MDQQRSRFLEGELIVRISIIRNRLLTVPCFLLGQDIVYKAAYSRLNLQHRLLQRIVHS